MKLFQLFALICILGSPSAHADERGMSYLIRQPTTMAMGGAGIGLADDEYTLFQNPAGLAGQEERKFHVLGLGLEASQDTYTVFGSSLNALKNFQTSSLNTLMGKDVYLRGDAVTMISLPHFSIAYIADAQGAIEQFNQANPTFKVGDMITHGVQAGMGWSLQQGRHATDEIRFGIAGKMLWRRGGYYDVSTAGFLSATTAGKSYIDNLVGNYGMGYGGDAGFQYIDHIDKRESFSFGASVLDIGDTKFSDPHADPIPMNIGFGFGYKKELDFFKIKVDADLRNLSQMGSLSTKMHVGGDLSIPLFDFYLGLNQLSPTYGVGFDIWILKVTLLSYADELGVYYGEDTSRRYMLQIDFNLPI